MIPRLHLVTDDRVLSDSRFPDALERATSAGGPRIAVHVRGPRTPIRGLYELGRAAVETARRHGTPLLVNDRVDLALVLGATGAHLGRRSLPVRETRTVLGSGALLGRSVHGAAEARSAAEDDDRAGGVRGVDFLFAGTIFETPSHPDRQPAGVDRIREVRRARPSLPVLAIGGISAGRIGEVIDAGAHGVAVIRAVWEADDPGEAVGELLAEIDANMASGGR